MSKCNIWEDTFHNIVLPRFVYTFLCGISKVARRRKKKKKEKERKAAVITDEFWVVLLIVTNLLLLLQDTSLESAI